MNWFGIDAGIKYLLLAALAIAAIWVFARVKADYARLRRLSRRVAVLQTAYFCAYAISSYVFLDSRIYHVGVRGALLVLAAALMAAGALIVALSMPFLGRRSFGIQVGRLRTTGLYRCSRNPQLVGAFLFIVGYASLWPSLHGYLWATLWPIIASLMVQAEEAHLLDVFGDQYAAYCLVTPRYLGIPRQEAKTGETRSGRSDPQSR